MQCSYNDNKEITLSDYAYTIKVIFTDWDTVKINDNEKTTKEYFNALEEKIKNNEIKQFKYNSKKNTFTYYMDGRKYSINIEKTLM